MAEVELKKRTMAEMVAYFNREVSMMDIPQKCNLNKHYCLMHRCDYCDRFEPKGEQEWKG